MFPGRQDLNFWCRFMCIRSVNWPPQFSEVIRGKHQKPITVSRTLNQTDKSLKRYSHEKLTGGFLRRLKMCGVALFFFFFFIRLGWRDLQFFLFFFPALWLTLVWAWIQTVDIQNKVNLKALYFRRDAAPPLPFFFYFFICYVTARWLLFSYSTWSESKEVNSTRIYWTDSGRNGHLVFLLYSLRTSCLRTADSATREWRL